METNDVSLSADSPVELATEDAFGHDDYAAAAAETLLAAQAPFTLGVFGDWGVGKTTIIRAIGNRVKRAGLGFIEFDVWRYEGDALRRQFLREVAEQLKAQKQLPRTYRPERELRDLEVDIPVPEERFRFSARGLIVALAQGLVLFVSSYLFLRSSLPRDIWGPTKQGTSTSQEVAGVIAAIGFAYSWLGSIFRVEQRFVTVRRVEDPERFQSKFCEILAKTEARRVVVAIDNLDRCNPDVVDTLLATIKTYLEPITHGAAAGIAETVFVIAADDVAVRRHMTARELASSPRESGKGYQGNLRDAEREVDEYLRKYFNATIRVRPLLFGDVRAYAEQKLQPFLSTHVLVPIREPGEPVDENLPLPSDAQEAAARERLVAMVVSALRRNPRRIKQFINNLEARLRTIEARERSGRIAPPISDDVLGIAKVAIIEEEWRDEYEALEKDHRKLSEWQAEVVEGDLVNPDLTAFLRTTRDVVPTNVSAIVNLKLEREDLELPDLAEFREAVAYGDYAAARHVLEQASDENRERYAARLPEILRNELRGGGVVQARNVLDAALQDPPLGVSSPEVKRRVMSDALAHPQLVAEFPTINGSRVFAALDLVSVSEKKVGRKPFIELGSLASQGEVLMIAVGQELAKRVHELDPDERATLQSQVSVEPTGTQVRPAFLPIANADPLLVTEQIARNAFQAIPTGDLAQQDPNLQLFMIGVRQGLVKDLIEQFGERLRSQLVESLADSDRWGLVAGVVEMALQELVTDEEWAVDDLLGAIRENVSAVLGHEPHEAWIRWLLVVASVADRLENPSPSTTAEAQELARALVDAAPIEVARVLSSGSGFTIGPAVGEALRERLEGPIQSLSPGTDDWEDVARGLTAIDKEQAAGLIRDEAIRRTSIQELDEVAAIVRRMKDDLGQQDVAIVDAIQAALAGGVITATQGYELVIRILDAASAAGAARITEVLRAGLLGSDAAGAEAARDALASQEAEHFRPEQLASLRASLIEGVPKGFEDSKLPVLKYLAFATRGVAEERRKVRTIIVQWLDDSPDFAPEIAAAIRPYDLPADERLPVVRGFLRASRTAGNAEWRAQAFAGAVEVAGKSRPALRLCRQAVEAMEASPDATDQEAAPLARAIFGGLS